MQQLTSIFIIVARSKQDASMSTWLYFIPHSYVFVLKLRESFLKSLKITFKKIV